MKEIREWLSVGAWLLAFHLSPAKSRRGKYHDMILNVRAHHLLALREASRG